MKDQETIKRELENQYLHRLQLRLDRKLKNCCKNCKHGKEQEFNLGEFGIHTKFVCKEDMDMSFPCTNFEPAHTAKSIEESLLSDIRDPAVCGAKEPKIAALLWVLHDEGNTSFISKIKNLFSKD